VRTRFPERFVIVRENTEDLSPASEYEVDTDAGRTSFASSGARRSEIREHSGAHQADLGVRSERIVRAASTTQGQRAAPGDRRAQGQHHEVSPTLFSRWRAGGREDYPGDRVRGPASSTTLQPARVRGPEEYDVIVLPSLRDIVSTSGPA